MEALKPLKLIFDDVNYAWDLLQNQVRLETGDNISGEDISYLLQLYMRGVEKMNSLVDIRQSFFRSKVTSLMSRQSVIKILNNNSSMNKNKKKKVDEVQISSPVKKIDSKVELELKQKRKQIQMRLAYGAEEHSPDALKKMISAHTQKESILESKIEKIIDNHEERLAKRIRQRKLRTLTAKSRSDVYMNEAHEIEGLSKKQMMQKKRDQEQFGSNFAIIEQKPNNEREKNRERRGYKSLQAKRSEVREQQTESPNKARRISVDFKYLNAPKQFNIE